MLTGKRNGAYKHGETVYVNGRHHLSPEYVSWCMARGRCRNQNKKEYTKYGGAGITFSPLWDDFRAFLVDMGRRPGPGYSLDRIDGTKGYYKGNCRWATRKEQAYNRITTKQRKETST